MLEVTEYLTIKINQVDNTTCNTETENEKCMSLTKCSFKQNKQLEKCNEETGG